MDRRTFLQSSAGLLAIVGLGGCTLADEQLTAETLQPALDAANKALAARDEAAFLALVGSGSETAWRRLLTHAKDAPTFEAKLVAKRLKDSRAAEQGKEFEISLQHRYASTDDDWYAQPVHATVSQDGHGWKLNSAVMDKYTSSLMPWQLEDDLATLNREHLILLCPIGEKSMWESHMDAFDTTLAGQLADIPRHTCHGPLVGFMTVDPSRKDRAVYTTGPNIPRHLLGVEGQYMKRFYSFSENPSPEYPGYPMSVLGPHILLSTWPTSWSTPTWYFMGLTEWATRTSHPDEIATIPAEVKSLMLAHLDDVVSKRLETSATAPASDDYSSLFLMLFFIWLATKSDRATLWNYHYAAATSGDIAGKLLAPLGFATLDAALQEWAAWLRPQLH